MCWVISFYSGWTIAPVFPSPAEPSLITFLSHSDHPLLGIPEICPLLYPLAKAGINSCRLRGNLLLSSSPLRFLSVQILSPYSRKTSAWACLHLLLCVSKVPLEECGAIVGQSCGSHCLFIFLQRSLSPTASFSMPANSDSHISYNFTDVFVGMPNPEPVTLSKQKYLLALSEIQKLRKAINLPWQSKW